MRKSSKSHHPPEAWPACTVEGHTFLGRGVHIKQPDIVISARFAIVRPPCLRTL